MRRGLIAMNPKAGEGALLERFCNQIRHLQERSFWEELRIVSVVHRSYFSYNSESYKDLRDDIFKEVHDSLNSNLQGKLPFREIDVIESPTSTDEDVVKLLSQWVFHKRCNFLILGVDGKHALTQGPFGGVPSTAAYTAPVPLLVVDVNCEFKGSDEPTVLLAVDSSNPPSSRALRRFAKIIRPLKAKVFVLHVLRRRKIFKKRGQPVAAFDRGRKALYDVAHQLQDLGIDCEIDVVKEHESVAQTIAIYAQKNGIWITAVTSPVRDLRHRLLWGSTTQFLLGHLQSPLLLLRTG